MSTTTAEFRTLGPSDAICPTTTSSPTTSTTASSGSRSRASAASSTPSTTSAPHEACPLSGGPAHRHDAHVPVPRLPVRHHHRRRDPRARRPSRSTTYEVREENGDIQIRA